MTTENSGAPSPQSLLAELRAQVEQARNRLANAEAALDTDRACRLANEAELRRADALVGELRRERDEANNMLSTACSKLQMLVMAHAACWDQFMPGRPAAALDNAQAFLDAPRAAQFVSLDSFRGLESHRGALLRGLEAMRRDGLDIDDLHTAPVWTGKVMDGERVVFDLATYEDVAEALEHERNNTMCAEAACAAMREALEAMVSYHQADGPAADHHRDDCRENGSGGCEECRLDGMVNAALATDVGKAMLERVRAAERLVDERDAAQKAVAVTTQQRDEAREALRNLLAVVQHCYPLPSVPDADLHVRTAARILKVKP